MTDEVYTGRIVKALAGFYYVRRRPDGCIYACKAKGIFRKRGHSPLVGDVVDFIITHEGDKEGNIERIYERTSVLKRPTVANVDLALVVFALKKPDPNTQLLDRMLVEMEHSRLSVIICFNKMDLAEDKLCKEWMDRYTKIGYECLLISAAENEGIDELKDKLIGHRTTVAGPSGAGKSSIINALSGASRMETGNVSERIGRGKQTTRHTELIRIAEHSYIVDTPGFSSLELSDITKEDLWEYFPEFEEYARECKYPSCSHIYEPSADCPVRAAYEDGSIDEGRYSSYKRFYEELKERKDY